MPQNRYIPSHKKNDSLFRIATYNIHCWHKPLLNKPEFNFDKIFGVISAVNADVIILQEVVNRNFFDSGKQQKIDLEKFKEIDYQYSLFSLASSHAGAIGDNFGNMILSKEPFDIIENKQYPLDKSELNKQGPDRSYVGIKISLSKNKSISLWGTHLDVYDESEVIRKAQIEYLIKLIDKKSGEEENKNIIIGADFNAIRMDDYKYSVQDKNVWDMVQEDYKIRGIKSVPTDVHNVIKEKGFVDCFTKLGIDGPKFTVWPGVVVDFLYLKNWDLEIAGCYIYYDAASDHVPVIMDIKIPT